MNFIDYSEGMTLFMAARRKQGRERLRLFASAEKKFARALQSVPSNVQTLGILFPGTL
jgi:hypothetical protein